MVLLLNYILYGKYIYFLSSDNYKFWKEKYFLETVIGNCFLLNEDIFINITFTTYFYSVVCDTSIVYLYIEWIFH